MTDDKRAAIAFICGIKFISRNINYLYDYTRNKYCFYILQHVDKNQISVYDFDTKNIIMGKLPQLFDYATRSYLHIDFKDKKAQGFDFQTSNFFSVSVSKLTITVFDYKENNFFSYIV